MADAAELVEDNDVMVPMRDGIRLRTDVFRPATGGPHPVLVQRYPYSPRDGFGAMFGRMIAAQGYAVVVQSCRGRFGSEGDFSPIHPDVEDGYDTVEWAAAQPWSNGKVGMYGASYGGMTQWTAAMGGPPHLVCLAPVRVHLGRDRRRMVLRPRRPDLGPGRPLERPDDRLRGGAARGGATPARVRRTGEAARRWRSRRSRRHGAVHPADEGRSGALVRAPPPSGHRRAGGAGAVVP